MAGVDVRELGAIFAGGVAGGLARSGLAEALPADAGAWPWATFVVNLGGAFLLGWLVTRLQERLPQSAYKRPLLGTGVCGALTTFSTLQLQLVELAEDGHAALAVGYAATSLAGGLAAVFCATQLARRTRLTA